jgi:hypothetical protein
LQPFRQDLAAIFDCVLAGHYKRLSHLRESEAFVRLQIELLRNRNTVADDGYVLKSRLPDCFPRFLDFGQLTA